MNTMGEIFCISGPDKGKRLRLGEQTVMLGRSHSCGLLSDDPALGSDRVALAVIGGVLHFRASSGGGVFVDGVPKPKGALQAGEQLRAGRSCWQFNSGRAAAPKSGGLFGQLGDFVNSAVGLQRPEGFGLHEVISSVTEKRSEHDLTEFFTIGTSKNTPELAEIDTSWPKPWVFFKALSLAVLVYLGFVFAFYQFQNANLIPGLIMVGASAIPVSVVIFYFEMNAARNVSAYQVIRLLLLGGVVSLITSLFGFQIINLDWRGASSAGIIEETGKLLALLIMVNKTRYRWTLNGLLFGGTVGAGFAAFESAGYAFRTGLVDLGGMFENIWVRGLLAPGGHVAWTALVGAALWKVKGDRPFSVSMLTDPRLMRVMGMAMALHMAWNSPLELPFFGKYIILMVVAWMAILGFIQDGLGQIRQAQAEAVEVVKTPRQRKAVAV